jgi:hypothetical protein
LVVIIIIISWVIDLVSHIDPVKIDISFKITSTEKS